MADLNDSDRKILKPQQTNQTEGLTRRMYFHQRISNGSSTDSQYSGHSPFKVDTSLDSEGAQRKQKISQLSCRCRLLTLTIVWTIFGLGAIWCIWAILEDQIRLRAWAWRAARWENERKQVFEQTVESPQTQSAPIALPQRDVRITHLNPESGETVISHSEGSLEQVEGLATQTSTERAHRKNPRKPGNEGRTEFLPLQHLQPQQIPAPSVDQKTIILTLFDEIPNQSFATQHFSREIRPRNTEKWIVEGR